jgi:hypothetical protein
MMPMTPTLSPTPNRLRAGMVGLGMIFDDTYRPVFLQKIAPFNGPLRMMDWLSTVNFVSPYLGKRFAGFQHAGIPCSTSEGSRSESVAFSN